MNAIINDHLVEIIEPLPDSLWLVYDTVTGLFFTVSEQDLFYAICSYTDHVSKTEG